MLQINKDVLALQLQNEVTKFIQERLELMMREELDNFLRVEHPDEKNARNGYKPMTGFIPQPPAESAKA